MLQTKNRLNHQHQDMSVAMNNNLSKKPVQQSQLFRISIFVHSILNFNSNFLQQLKHLMRATKGVCNLSKSKGHTSPQMQNEIIETLHANVKKNLFKPLSIIIIITFLPTKAHVSPTKVFYYLFFALFLKIW